MDQLLNFENCSLEHSINYCEWTAFTKTYDMFYTVTYRVNKTGCVILPYSNALQPKQSWGGLLGNCTKIVLFRLHRQSRTASDLASNLPGHCPDWEGLGVTACCEHKTCSTIDKMGEKSWDGWAPRGGPGQPSPRLSHTPSFTRQKQTALKGSQACSLVTDWPWCQFAFTLGL